MYSDCYRESLEGKAKKKGTWGSFRKRVGELERAFCRKVIEGLEKRIILGRFFKLVLKIKKIKSGFYSLLVSFGATNAKKAWVGLKKQVILNFFTKLNVEMPQKV